MRLPLLLLTVTLGIGFIAYADESGTTPVATEAEPDCDDPTANAEWLELLAAVDVLEHGTRQEKLALFEHNDQEVDGPFDNDWPDPECAGGAVEGMIDRLRSWASGEADTWLLDLAAGNIAYWGYDAALPLFGDLARHPAPSLRARAIQQAIEMNEDRSLALLLDMWPAEREPWVMALLLEAIDDLTHVDVDGSTPPYDRCVELIRHDDPELAAAAMACAARNDLPGAQSALVAAVVEDPAEPARRALAALADVGRLSPQSRSRLEALMTSEFDPRLRRGLFEILTLSDAARSLAWARGVLDGDAPDRALEALARIGASDDPDDRERLVKLAFDGAPEVRAEAIGLAARDLAIPEVPEILARGLASSAVQVRLAAVDAIIKAHRLHPETTREELASGKLRYVVTDDIQALMPLFERIGRDDPDTTVRERVRVFQEHGAVIRFRTSCASPIGDATIFRLAEVGLGGTLRCFGAPAIERPPDDTLRAAKGGLVLGKRRFDDGRSVWWEVSLFGGQSCWLPEAVLEPGDLAAYQASEFDLPPPLEFDLAHAETRTEGFLELEASGLLARFDPGREVTGVALLLEGAGREGLEALLQAAGIEGPLGRALEPHDASLRERLAALGTPGDR